MLQFITGVPKSGKTYYLVYQAHQLNNKTIEENIKNDDLFLYEDSITDIKESKKDNYSLVTRYQYSKIYHNIAGYKEYNYIDTLDFQSKVNDLYNYFKSVEKDVNKDTLLIEKMKDFEWFNSFFVLDECHIFLSTQSRAFLWFFSYHAHLHIDLLLATQSLGLVNFKYKAFAETFIKAVSSSLRLHNFSFSYRTFPTSWMNRNEEMETIKLPVKSEIFELYKAGSGGSASTSVKKWSALVALLGLGVVYGFYSFLTSDIVGSNNSPGEIKKITSPGQTSLSKTKKVKSIVRKVKPLSKEEIVSNSKYQINNKILKVRCIDSLCKFEDYEFDADLFFYYVPKTSILKKKDVYQNYYISYLLSLDDAQYGKLVTNSRKIAKSEKNNNSTNLFKSSTFFEKDQLND